MYKLTYSPASPYVRKVRLAGYLSGLNDQIELLNPDHETHIKMKLNNPLGKIPVLMTPNNQYVFDSRVIVELLNDTSGKLYPKDDNKKIILTMLLLLKVLLMHLFFTFIQLDMQEIRNHQKFGKSFN